MIKMCDDWKRIGEMCGKEKGKGKEERKGRILSMHSN